MLRVTAAAFSVWSTLAGSALAHDFWLSLDRWTHDGESAAVEAEFLVGHAGDQTNWTLRPEREVALVAIGPSGRTEHTESLIYPTAAAKAGAALTLQGEGLHIIAFETDHAFSDLPAEKFNAYLVEEGLTPAIDHRRTKNGNGLPGREAYSRRAKALVRIGNAEGAAPEATGQTLEIVALDNPYMLGVGAPLRLRIDYQGAPLAGASVTLQSLTAGLVPERRVTTDSNGVAAFSLPRSGAWMANVVWTRPVAKGEIAAFPEAEFETIFSSLTFGY